MMMVVNSKICVHICSLRRRTPKLTLWITVPLGLCGSFVIRLILIPVIAENHQELAKGRG
jgi:uncharacterized membrane protein YagU involved in acid resistance